MWIIERKALNTGFLFFRIKFEYLKNAINNLQNTSFDTYTKGGAGNMSKNRIIEITLPNSEKGKRDICSIKKAAITFGLNCDGFNFKTVSPTKIWFDGSEIETLQFLEMINPIVRGYFKDLSLYDILHWMRV